MRKRFWKTSDDNYDWYLVEFAARLIQFGAAAGRGRIDAGGRGTQN
jgi:hypothetical protein